MQNTNKGRSAAPLWGLWFLPPTVGFTQHARVTRVGGWGVRGRGAGRHGGSATEADTRNTPPVGTRIGTLNSADVTLSKRLRAGMSAYSWGLGIRRQPVVVTTRVTFVALPCADGVAVVRNMRDLACPAPLARSGRSAGSVSNGQATGERQRFFGAFRQTLSPSTNNYRHFILLCT